MTARPPEVNSIRTVLPLCCYGKVLDFMIKNTRLTQKTLNYKIKLTHIENAQKIHCNATIDIVQLICKPEAKKTGDSSTPVFAYRSLKLLTDDHSDFVVVELRTDYCSCEI